MEPLITPKQLPEQWEVGYGHGLTGPTGSVLAPCCGGDKWPYAVISSGKATIAIIPAQETGTHSFRPQSIKKTEARAAFIVRACKSHYELLEALEKHHRIVGLLSRLLRHYGKPNGPNVAGEPCEVKAALYKAKHSRARACATIANAAK